MAGRIFAKKVWVDGYCFDSEQEADYYKLLKQREEKGEISCLEIHKEFCLQQGFVKNGKIITPICYEADFCFYENFRKGVVVNNVDEDYETIISDYRIIDIKGFITDEFVIKQKLFEKAYHNWTLEVLAKDIDGQFKPIDEVKKNRKERKKQRKANKKEKEWAEYDTLVAKPKRTPKQEARLSELAVVYANKKHKKPRKAKVK